MLISNRRTASTISGWMLVEDATGVHTVWVADDPTIDSMASVSADVSLPIGPTPMPVQQPWQCPPPDQCAPCPAPTACNCPPAEPEPIEYTPGAMPPTQTGPMIGPVLTPPLPSRLTPPMGPPTFDPRASAAANGTGKAVMWGLLAFIGFQALGRK